MCAAFDDYYKMDHLNRGHVVIINNYKFDNPKYKSLKEYKNDVEKYKETFKIIGFKEDEIKVFENLTADGMKKKMEEYANKNYNDCDCFVGVFLSHGYKFGNKINIMGTDQEVLFNEELTDAFKGTKTLNEKPKIFFVDIFETIGKKKRALDIFGNLVLPVTLLLVSPFISPLPFTLYNAMSSTKFKTDINDCFFVLSFIDKNSIEVQSSNRSSFSNVLCEITKNNFHYMDIFEIVNKVKNVFKKRFEINLYDTDIISSSTMKKSCLFALKNNDDDYNISSELNENKSAVIPSSLPRKIINFVDRNDVLNQIKNTFNKDRKKIVILNSSRPGTGKSSIANEFGWESCIEDLTNVYWMNSENIDTEYEEFSEKFGIKIDETRKIEDIIEKTNHEIKKIKENFLFIFDYCEDIEQILKYIIKIPNNAKILITTNKDLKLDEIADKSVVINLRSFNKKEIENFIKLHLKELNNNDLEKIYDLVFEYLKGEEIRPYLLNKFISLFKFKPFNQFKNKEEIIQIITKRDFIDVLSEIIKEKDKIILDVLYHISFMHHNFIPFKMIKNVNKVDEETLQKLASNTFINIEFIEMEIGLKINRIFQNEIKENLKKKKNLKEKQKVIKNLETYIKSVFELESKVSLLKKKDFKNIQIIKDNIYDDLDKESKYFILNNFANYCLKIKKYDLALICFKDSLKIHR